MKKYIMKYGAIASLALMAVANSGCGKLADFGDTNISPNGVAEPITSALLTNAQAGIPGQTITLQPPSMFSQYLAEITYPGISKYTGLQINSSAVYVGPLQDLQVIINKNSDINFAPKAAKYGDNTNQIAIATILREYLFWTLTDRWGDIPYSQALQGANVLLPKYDEQKDIYAGILTKLAGAVDMFNPTAAIANPVQGDVIYGGNITKWRKFGNTLRMLIAVRMSKRYPNAGEFAATEFNKAMNSTYGYITDNADNFALMYTSTNFQNPFQALNVSQDIGVALTYTDALNNMGDTRRSNMCNATNGCPYGLSIAAPIGGTYARVMNGAYATATSTSTPLTLISAASSLLAKAEAIERGWVPGMTTADAQVAYEAAVTASFAQWGVTLPANFLTTGPANYTTGGGGGAIGGASVAGSSAATTTKLQRIQLQQWIAFYPDGTQGWSNFRRTGIPALKPTINAENPSKQIPQRYTYGTTDYSTNLDQLNIALGRMGGTDSQDTKVWWAQ